MVWVNHQGLVTDLRNGNARITAQVGVASASIPVTVMQKAVSIRLRLRDVLFCIGETAQLTATVRDKTGFTIENAVVTWASSNLSVATVNAEGLITAVGNGTAVVTVRAGVASQTVDVMVRQVVFSVTLKRAVPRDPFEVPDSHGVYDVRLYAAGETIQYMAAVEDQYDQTVEDVVVTWTSSDESVASTGLCLPEDPVLKDFMKRYGFRVPSCEPPTQRESVAFLTQATQSVDFPVPLVAGEDALLRVFVLGDDGNGADMPPVRARLNSV